MDIKIEYLCDNINFADDVAKWIYDEFVKPVRNDLSYKDVLLFIKKCNKETLPIRLVAIADGKCIGTISIVENDLKCREYTPFLASLYVEQQYRNNKIGEQLTENVKEIVRNLGYKELFLRTEHASNYYKRLGWEFIETCEDNYNLKPDLFKITL